MDVFTKKKYSFKELLKLHYHAETDKEFLHAFLSDLLVTVFFFSGSGLFQSILKGFYARLFFKIGWPALIGKHFKIIQPSKVKIGKNVWIKDFVALFAAGEISIDNNVVIYERTSIWSGKKGITIGDGVWFNMNCFIDGIGGSIKIGRNVLIADSVRMYTLDHNYKDTHVPIKDQGYKMGDILIEDNAWIGSGVIILKGVTVGKGAVVAAGSVVTKNVLPYTVVAGIPAKEIRKLV